MKLVLVVAAALVDGAGRVLIARRPAGKSMAGLWEFPGGKVNKDGETPEDALARELEEELGILADPRSFTPAGFASHAYDGFHLLMPLYICREWRNDPVAREHVALEWVRVTDLPSYPMPPADGPLIKALRDVMASGG